MNAQQADIDHRLVLDAVPYPLFLVNPNGTVTYGNTISVEIGILEGMRIWEQPFESMDEFQSIEAFNDHLTSRTQLSFKTCPGKFDMQISTFTTHGDICYMYILTGQKENVSILSATQPISESAFNDLRVEEIEDYAILMLDNNGKIINANKGIHNVKGYTIDEVVGKHFETFYQDEDRENGLPQMMLSEATSRGKAMTEGWRRRKDGTLFWGNVVITAVHDIYGETVGFTKVTRDFTERKLIEEEREKQARKIEAKNRQLEEFAYITSHDLQEPLRKISFFANLVQEKKRSQQEIDLYLQKIASSATRMRSLVQDILEYARILQQPEAQQKINLNGIILEVLDDFELLVKERNVDIIISDLLPLVSVIPVQMRQLFTNLISNAIKFCPHNPIIKIFSENVTIENNHKKLWPGNYHLISLTDNGVGFDQKYAEEIFKPFKRLSTEVSGSGIGLAVCQKIVENHGGDIDVSSNPNKGTTFKIYLPT